MRCDLRTVKHSLQTVYPCCRSVRSVRIDTWLIRTVTVRVYWTTLKHLEEDSATGWCGCDNRRQVLATRHSLQLHSENLFIRYDSVTKRLIRVWFSMQCMRTGILAWCTLMKLMWWPWLWKVPCEIGKRHDDQNNRSFYATPPRQC